MLFIKFMILKNIKFKYYFLEVEQINQFKEFYSSLWKRIII